MILYCQKRVDKVYWLIKRITAMLTCPTNLFLTFLISYYSPLDDPVRFELWRFILARFISSLQRTLNKVPWLPDLPTPKKCKAEQNTLLGEATVQT
jgi:hypothetical protein